MSDAPTPADRRRGGAGRAREGPPDDRACRARRRARERRAAALAQIRTFGDPVLKSRASEITSFGPELAREAERMVAIMHDAIGVGLAATQLGVMHRLLVFQAGLDATPTAVVNPELEWLVRRAGDRRGGLPQPARRLGRRRAPALCAGHAAATCAASRCWSRRRASRPASSSTRSTTSTAS